MKDQIHQQASLFDETNRRFGNLDGMTLVNQLSRMRDELNGLLPLQKQISSIRVPVLQKAAELKSSPILRQARNGLVYGGRILTDLNTIANENDPAEHAKLKQGFEHLYHLNFDDRRSFADFNAVVNIANIHANLLTLHEFKNRDGDVAQCVKLLEAFRGRIWKRIRLPLG